MGTSKKSGLAAIATLVLVIGVLLTGCGQSTPAPTPVEETPNLSHSPTKTTTAMTRVTTTRTTDLWQVGIPPDGPP